MTKRVKKQTQGSNGVRVLKEAELAQMLGYTRTQVRRRLRQIKPLLIKQGEPLRICKNDHVVLTDSGLAALKRVKELEELCLTAGEIRARLASEFGLSVDSKPVSQEEHDVQLRQKLETLEATVHRLEQELLAREKATPAPDVVSMPTFYSALTGRDVVQALLAGVIGTGVMTVFAMLAPLMGLPPMDVAGMLAHFMGRWIGFISLPLGWAAHFMIGGTLAFIYALWFVKILPGPAWTRGLVYGLLPWLVAQVAVMPLMGMGLFASAWGSMVPALQSLLGHLVYGVTVGAVYGKAHNSC